MHYVMARQGVGGGDIDKTELIKWFDILDELTASRRNGKLAKVMSLLRGCSHPDAWWLASLLHQDVPETLDEHHVVRVMKAQGDDDARALFVRACFTGTTQLVQRAAELGYAPAEAHYAYRLPVGRLPWVQRASGKGDRKAMWILGESLFFAMNDAVEDWEAGIEWLRRAAELGEARAQVRLGDLAYSEKDWQRYYWWGKAAVRGNYTAIVGVLKAAARNEAGRIAYEVGAACAGHLRVADVTAFGKGVGREELEAGQRCVAFFEKLIAAVRAGIACWLLIGRRLGVAKDIRVLIARLVWEERAGWSEIRKV
jgi:hypothetical protein